MGDTTIAGTMINVSLTGAAIRIAGSARWLSRLNHGDEMLLAGLFDRGLLCWLVTLDDGVMRIHFPRSDDGQSPLRGAIQEMIALA
jgi:hypothetical protein